MVIASEYTGEAAPVDQEMSPEKIAGQRLSSD